jgi:hypothetical protein
MPTKPPTPSGAPSTAALVTVIRYLLRTRAEKRAAAGSAGVAGAGGEREGAK